MSRGQTFRAFQIADEAMFELLVAHCVGGSDDAHLVLVNDMQDAVRRLDEASEAIQEAVEWLLPRGFVAIGSGDGGEFIAILRRPGTCELCDGSGQYFAHADRCDDSTCAVNGDMRSCAGTVILCECTPLPDEAGRGTSADQLKREASLLTDPCAS